jgi:hypothetical protein
MAGDAFWAKQNLTGESSRQTYAKCFIGKKLKHWYNIPRVFGNLKPEE